MDYDTLCRYVGQLFLESRKQIDGLSDQLRKLLSENAELKRLISADDNGPTKTRDIDS